MGFILIAILVLASPFLFWRGVGVVISYLSNKKLNTPPSSEAVSNYNSSLDYMIAGMQENDHAKYAKGLQLLRSAAEHGVVDAQMEIGDLYLNGDRVPRDYQEAMKWFRQAMYRKHDPGTFKVGMMYANGFGVRQNYMTAYQFIKPLADKRYKPAVEILDELSKRGVFQELGILPRGRKLR
ncbi:MAG: tetratricopeptide repeat protein [Gammaproteobacteria bacterium]